MSPFLRLTQHSADQAHHYRVELRFEDDGLSPLSAESSFAFELTPADASDLRWYLEDYLQYPMEPAPKIAARIEERLSAIGQELFQKVFESSPTASRIWARMYDRLNDTRVEISVGVREATAIPWEWS